MRNTDTGALLLGNLGFKQDATQSADQATRQAVFWLNSNSTNLNAHIAASGYYASTKEFADDGTTAAGVLDITGSQFPTAMTRQLIDWDGDSCAAYSSSSYAACIRASDALTINSNTANYIILRMCNKPGDYTTDTTVVCVKPMSSSSGGSTARGELNYSEYARFGSTAQTYFRVLTRIKGQRGTMSYTETIVHF
ncbi:MAG: hypothetical protein KGL57_05165 [Burkholderiales bacterium]|nr:hypothetical protein [Burkholderiales bacterium]